MSASLIVLAVILGGISTTLVAPFLIALYFEETSAAVIFASCAAAYAFLASAIFISLRGTEGGLKRVETFALLIQSWLLLVIAGAIPLGLVTQHSVQDVLFETVSMVSTSNASVFGPTELQTRAVLFWRSQLQWVGGLLTLLSIVVVLAPAGVGGLPKRQIALLEKVGIGGGGRIIKICLSITAGYVAFSVVATVSLAISGIPFFDAICLAAGLISTGGLAPIDQPLSSYGAPMALPICIIFMIIGATSILWHRMVFFRRGQLLREHRESYYLIGLAIGIGVLLAVMSVLTAPTENRDINNVLASIFTSTTLLTTTGLAWTAEATSALPTLLVSFIVLIGGGAYSTAGGLKLYRMGGMLIQSAHELNRLVFPHSIQSDKFGGTTAELDMLKAIWSFLVATVLLIWGTAAVLTIDGIPFEAAVIAAISAFSSIGSIYDPGTANEANWPSFADMTNLSKLVIGTTMLLGRIEVLAFFGLFNLTYWKAR